MAKWYPKWFGDFFKGWFSTSSSQVEPPTPPSVPPTTPITSRAAIESPSIASGMRAGRASSGEDSQEPCFEFEPGIDVENIEKTIVGCQQTAPPQPAIPKCGTKYPRKITASWSAVGNKTAALEYPDRLFTYFDKWPPLEGTPWFSSRIVGNDPTQSISSLTFNANPFAESLIEGSKQYPDLFYSGDGFPQDLYTLEAVKLGPDISVTSTMKKYGWFPDPLPPPGAPIVILQRPPDCQGSETDTIEFTTITTGHLSFHCKRLTGNIWNGEPAGVIENRYYIKFYLSRYLAVKSPINPNSNGFNAFVYVDTYNAVGGGAISRAPDGIGWPGCGVMYGEAPDIPHKAASVTVQGYILQPPSTTFPFGQPGLAVEITFTMSDWVEIT